jgi:hypothetical protein
MYLLQGHGDALLTTYRNEADDLCTWENSQLATWTFLRYCVIGLILLWRVWRIRRGAQGLTAPFTVRPYSEHPKLTQNMQEAAYGVDWALAGCMFIQTEGVGLTIYFTVSAMMDNIAIFIASGDGFCHTVAAVSLYTMALVTFLPNVWLGITLQAKYYNHGSLMTKLLFVAGMVFTTSVFFMVRLLLVYKAGYAWSINGLLDNGGPGFRVVLAVAVPPLVDAIQSIVLISTGMEKEHEALPEQA